MAQRGTVIQINTSRGGLPKLPIISARVSRLGIVGDEHRFRYHGGPIKALLLASSVLIDELCAEGWPLFYGALGENLTVRGLDARFWRPHQRFRAGSVLLELTQPRDPCRKLNMYGKGIQERIFDELVKALDPGSPKWGYSGFYSSVLQAGRIRPDDIIEAVDHDL
jgi:MOSC domain-containing protein YiiM